MAGWKTYTAAAIVGFTSVGIFLGWIDRQQAELILGLAAALGLTGLRHKMDKIENGK